MDTRGCPGVGGFSASLSEEMSSASPNRSSAAAFVAADSEGSINHIEKKKRSNKMSDLMGRRNIPYVSLSHRRCLNLNPTRLWVWFSV